MLLLLFLLLLLLLLLLLWALVEQQLSLGGSVRGGSAEARGVEGGRRRSEGLQLLERSLPPTCTWQQLLERSLPPTCTWQQLLERSLPPTCTWQQLLLEGSRGSCLTGPSGRMGTCTWGCCRGDGAGSR